MDEYQLSALFLTLSLSESWQRSMEAAGRSLVSIVVDHIFLCIKDAGLFVFIFLC